MAPVVVMRPTVLVPLSVNHSAPSGPIAIPCGELPAAGTEYTVITPATVTRPIAADVVNHIAPSGPALIARAPPETGNSSLTKPAVVIRAI
jgi:hypothetical protein